MRSAMILVGCGALAGCAALSGLDHLSVGSGDAAAEDATPFDATSSDGGSDAPSDVSVDASPDVSCSYTGGVEHCFGQSCQNQTTCCVNVNEAACLGACGTGSIPMACTSNAECLTAQNTCCLDNVATIIGGCPLLLESGQTQTASTECTSSDTCNVAGHVRLCAANADCLNGQTCMQAVFNMNESKIFGLCH